MIVFNAPEKLLQDIAARVGVQLVIATDHPAELADADQEFIGKWFSPAPSDAVSHEIDSMYGAATDPGPEFGSPAWFAGIDPEEF